MRRIGIWERDEDLCRQLRRDIQRIGLTEPEVLYGRHPAELVGSVLDLLVISPNAAGWAGAGSITCRLVLLPGSAAPMVKGIRVEGAVSYGTGPRDTITLSSLKEDSISLAVQRELVTVEGGVVERQELVLPYSPSVSAELFMVRAGALLLLGSETGALRLLKAPSEGKQTKE